MNPVIETILKRKGTKSYKPEQIKDEDLELILSAGIAGPTARNSQNRHFAVVQNKEILQQINDGSLTLQTAPSHNYPLFQAPTAIIVSTPADYPFADQDSAIALENMAIAATALGLGSRYLVSPTRFIEHTTGAPIKEQIGIPQGYRTIAVLIVGYDANPAQEPVERKTEVVTYIR
ncbi:nitroreductase family protein [Desulfitobacterium chlororespirans]|uniref:Nitroreductase n=1 Tax=Desulfitobacterium chlororespirans DSM 11544 TaxID=1121395 RepID=A0A1M7RYQ7_9FIRM|nr:nitroreductase family protein [Desulfitobacterium chlororespirans]SHN51290.1 Nitroreductase [Desulfitobacterium chlororespirans DSM 11544]